VKNRSFIALALTLFTTFFAGTAAAYVGPGAGITVLGALWGLIIGVVMAIGVILFWPIRMLLRKRKAKQAALAEGAATENPPAEMKQSGSETSQSS
jgi:hypothetical protein